MMRMDCYVEVFESFSAPYVTDLKVASPSEEVTVVVYTGNHFNSCIATLPRGGPTPPPRRAQPLFLLSRSNPPTEGGDVKIKKKKSNTNV